MLMAAPLSAFCFIVKPAIRFFTLIKKLINKLTGVSKRQPSVTEEELKYIIDEIETEGVLEEQESDLVRSALDFDETEIGEVLVPRVNIVGVELHADIETIKDSFFANCYSRMPVYDRTVDSIVGIIHQADFFKLYLTGGRDIESIMKEPVYIPESKRISEVMRLMQKKKVHMAVVVDQYGGTEGICTLEDIIEELVGDIYDESDEEDSSFIRLGENMWQASAELSVSDFLEKAQLSEKLIEADSNSLGGWVVERLDRFPENGERVELSPFVITVKMEDAQRIDALTVELSEKSEKPDIDGNFGKED
jgi:CBS domain containing-hemolysin-like protein